MLVILFCMDYIIFATFEWNVYYGILLSQKYYYGNKIDTLGGHCVAWYKYRRMKVAKSSWNVKSEY